MGLRKEITQTYSHNSDDTEPKRVSETFESFGLFDPEVLEIGVLNEGPFGVEENEADVEVQKHKYAT